LCAKVHDYNVLNELLRQDNPGRPVLSEQMRAAHPPVLRPLVVRCVRAVCGGQRGRGGMGGTGDLSILAF
jgi:hypothetical protein